MHTCIHTYIHTYIYACMHTCIHTIKRRYYYYIHTRTVLYCIYPFLKPLSFFRTGAMWCFASFGVLMTAQRVQVSVCVYVCMYVYRRALVVDRETDTEMNTQYVVPMCVHDTEEVVESP